ncbi:MAG: hypothetical protein ABI969_15095, partial [bacterium]
TEDEAAAAARKISARLAFTDAQIFSSSRVLRWFIARIGFETRAQIVSLVLLVVVPFALFAAATIAEHRFGLGSVARACPECGAGREVIGMSFLGDPMVWPFFVFLPLTLLLLKYASSRLRDYLQGIPQLIEKSALQTVEQECDGIVRDLEASLAGTNDWKWVNRVAVAAAIVMVGWNWFTCTYDRVPVTGAAPYASSRVHVRYSAGPLANTTAPWVMELQQPIAIPKWDVEPRVAPVSWSLTRLWVVFGYGLLPLILAKVANLVGVLHTSTRRLLTRRDHLVFRPLAADEVAGFAKLSHAALALAYLSVPFTLMTALAYMKEGAPPSAHDYLLIALMLPLTSTAFLLPVGAVHRSLKRAKDRYLETLSAPFDRIHDRLVAILNLEHPDKSDMECVEMQLKLLREQFEQASKAPEWPVEVGIAIRFALTSVMPVAMFLYKEVLPHLK